MATTIPALWFKQWLIEWEGYEFSEDQQRRRPDPTIFLFSMPAVQLRALSGVYRRRRDEHAAEGLQRIHDENRSKLIRDFVRHGYPFSSIRTELRGEDTLSLRKPGWLPTAIVVNILTKDDVRRGRRVADQDLLSISKDENKQAKISLPYDDRNAQWCPSNLEPIEIIDGQHRLWAFDESISEGDLPGDFELPVVAFHGLDVGWQAYLFWSINISPKRINPSHAFDLYPLLRSQDWLETQSEIKIYREARAQELTELMFLQPESPWFNRINMLGESASTAPSGAGVSQAGWVRGLSSTFLSPGGRGRAAKGLFAAPIDNSPLEWVRPQQAALLVELWSGMRDHITKTDPRWAKGLRVREKGQSPARTAREDPFCGTRTMLNQEQGLRGVLAISNEILYAAASQDPQLFSWELGDEPGSKTTVDDVSVAIRAFKKHKVAKFVRSLTEAMAEFDWRSSDAPNLTDRQRLTKRAFRGSGGYVALREQLLKHMAGYDTAAGRCAAALVA